MQTCGTQKKRQDLEENFTKKGKNLAPKFLKIQMKLTNYQKNTT